MPFQLHMRIQFLALLVVLALSLVHTFGATADSYPDNKQLIARVKKLASDHKAIARATEVCETPGKNEVWRLELGAGNESARTNRPAMLVVAGIEANDLAGTASALAWAETLVAGYATNDAIKKLLDSTTIHLWPRVNPDGAAVYFAQPRRETTTSQRPTDDDRDGLTDEDGAEDLNADGIIASMRVEDPDGEFILDPQDNRLLLKADRLKGERGAWRILSEGRDNDGDKEWNEDGPGGVNFNRNFPYGYKFFAADAGRHQVSEVETRALAEFVIAHPQIAVVFTFGLADNLSQTPKGDAPKRPPTALHEEDVAWYRELGKAWREQLGVKKELSGATEPGTFSDWMYFHRGRLSLAARAWTPALQLELAKAAAKDEKPKDEPKKDGDAKPDGEKKPDAKPKEPDNRNEEDRAFLKWIDQNDPSRFIPWKSIEHPDFRGKRVEVGGFAPFARTLPPAKSLPDLAAMHGRFLTDLAGKLPRIAIRSVEAKSLGASVYEVTVKVENTGYLPTSLAQGGVSREVHPTRVVLKVDPKQLLSGNRVTMLNAIAGGDAKEARWVVRAKDAKKLSIEVISMIAGRTETEVELKEETK